MVTNEDIPVVKVESASDGVRERSCNKKVVGACCTDTWVKVHNISLTFEEKYILEQGDKLIDKHINCAQQILKLKFPQSGMGLHWQW